jgi:electron transfer flavoprotein beta subunit
MGADRGILVKADGNLEPLAVAKILKAIVEEEKPGLGILGKQAIDDDSNQTGQMLAALLGWSQATFASKLEVDGTDFNVTRDSRRRPADRETQGPGGRNDRSAAQ